MLKSTDAHGAVGAARPRHDNANQCASVVSASAEAPEGSSADEVGEHHRAWLRSLFVDLAKDAGARNPLQLAQQLGLLYDGAGISAWMDHDASAAQAARSVAVALVDAALPEHSGRGRKRK